MRRLFIMRKDLHMSSGKLAAQVGHCAEAYWTNMLKDGYFYDLEVDRCGVAYYIDKNVYEQYICGSFVKTICEARNKSHLLKAKATADEMGLIEGKHYGLIYDKCLTELTPEEDDGTTLTGIWFCPLPDEQAHEISKKYHLYV